MSGLAAAAGLVLAALAVTRAAKSPLSVPLALLAGNQFAWNTSSVFLYLTGDLTWRWVGAIAPTLLPPAAFWFVLAFVGKTRQLRKLHLAVWLVYGLQTIVATAVFFAPSLWPRDPFGPLSLVHLACDLPLLAFGVTLIVRHLRRTTDTAERSRARLLIIALVVLVSSATTDMLADNQAWFSVVVEGKVMDLRLAALGSFAFNAMLFVLTNRMGVFTDTERAATGATTVVTVLLALVGYLAVFAYAQKNGAILVIGLTTVTLALLAFGRYAISSWAAERAGLERLALMGRFSAQMAHDLKNPLAAAYGAAQVMQVNVQRGQPVDEEMMTEMVRSLGRLKGLIDRYQKLGKLELAAQPMDLNELVKRVLALRQLAPTPGVTIATELSSESMAATADVELLTAVLENLLKNAAEAMPNGGTITVRTRVHESPENVLLEVEDTGHGMSARVLAHAGEPFRTTKAQGSGLGLSLVRDVARAHGGDMTLWSLEGKGTRVGLWIPREQPRPVPQPAD
jgi:two-component system, NtrC family, sensor histidine kinase HydH